MKKELFTLMLRLIRPIYPIIPDPWWYDGNSNEYKIWGVNESFSALME